ncbi:MAG: nucleotidyltransferase [Desulfurococcales archaeon]|nr:nucleotidyltransferase [Desulfurococcales archaeon]
MVSASIVGRVVKELAGEGFRFTIIGGTVVELALGSRDLGDDVDVYAEEPDVLVEEEKYREVAERRGWVLGQTWLGTPMILVRVGDVEVPVEFYDNMFDFYVPPSMVERARRASVGGARAKVVRLEDHIVLKANAGREKDIERLREIASLASKGKLHLNLKAIKEAASEFDDEPVILRRLRDAGFRV